MSRYDDHSPRGPGERWDAGRFERERGGRQIQIMERDRYEEHDRNIDGGGRRRESSADDFYFRRRVVHGGGGERFEDDRFHEREERYGPPARRPGGGGSHWREKRYYEEDEVDSFESSPTGGVGPGRRQGDNGRLSGGGRGAPPRPGMLIRRQSSLDTFDRKPMPRYGPPRPHSPPEVIAMPGPGRRRKPSPPRYYERDYEDIRIAEPDRYGDENFRGWKEREVETVRRRRRDSSPEFKEREIEEVEEFIEEKPFPRKGRTKMSSRLVNKRAIIEIGYPFEEDIGPEGDFIIILKALNKELIDEVLFKSKEYNERDRERTTYMIEAPPPPSSGRGEVIERREIIIEKTPAEVPRSVREWDVMSGTINSGGKNEHVHSSHHGGGHSEHGSSHTTIKHHERSRSPSEIVIERKPSNSHHSSRSHGGQKVEYVAAEETGESNPITTGPLALVLPHRSKSQHGYRDEKRIKEEIRELEAEKRRLREERKHEKKYRRHHDHSDSDEEVIIERRDNHHHHHRKEREIKIEKDRKGNMAFVR
ncbi:MAG: hypothetical protein Q9163_002228 [Psora crenata]